MREARRARRELIGSVHLKTQDAVNSGKLVIEAEGVSYGYGGQKPIIDDFSTCIMRGDKTGIIGPNGSGKTTLLRVLLGNLSPERGVLRHGVNLETAYLTSFEPNSMKINRWPKTSAMGMTQSCSTADPGTSSATSMISCFHRNRPDPPSARFPAESATGSCWRVCLLNRRTCSYSMNRQTILISKLWNCSKTCFWTTAARCCW